MGYRYWIPPNYAFNGHFSSSTHWSTASSYVGKTLSSASSKRTKPSFKCWTISLDNHCENDQAAHAQYKLITALKLNEPANMIENVLSANWQVSSVMALPSTWMSRQIRWRIWKNMQMALAIVRIVPKQRGQCDEKCKFHHQWPRHINMNDIIQYQLRNIGIRTSYLESSKNASEINAKLNSSNKSQERVHQSEQGKSNGRCSHCGNVIWHQKGLSKNDTSIDCTNLKRIIRRGNLWFLINHDWSADI